MKQTESVLKVRSIYSGNGISPVEKESEIIEVVRLEDAPTATVSVDKSFTKNLGNYQSLKISAFLSVPCYLNEEEINRAFDYAAKKVDAAIIRVMQEEGIA